MKFSDVKNDYTKLWGNCIVKPEKLAKVGALCKKVLANKPKYDPISTKTGVPWYMIAMIHNMEADMDFSRCLHNGQPWNKKTTLVPAGRGPWSSFEEAALDALNYDGLSSNTDWSVEKCLFFLESFNGWGYRTAHPASSENKFSYSPYLWSMTNNYTTGKYVESIGADGKPHSTYVVTLVSDQIGSAAVLKQLQVFNAAAIQPPVLTGVQHYNKGANVQLTKNFNTSELDCKCGYPECTTTLIDLDHIKKLQEKREKLGKPIHINCGYRCEKHNLEVGGVKGSQHQLGTATDIAISGMTPQQIAQEFDGFDGVGTYNTFVHVDSRGYKARWSGNS